jgi:hypothetical protein
MYVQTDRRSSAGCGDKCAAGQAGVLNRLYAKHESSLQRGYGAQQYEEL